MDWDSLVHPDLSPFVSKRVHSFSSPMKGATVQIPRLQSKRVSIWPTPWEAGKKYKLWSQATL